MVNIPLFIGFHGKHPIIYRLSTAFNMFQPSQIGGFATDVAGRPAHP